MAAKADLAAVSQRTDVCWEYLHDYAKIKSNVLVFAMPDWTAFGRWPSNAQGHFECSYTYVIQRLALWQNDCCPECMIFFHHSCCIPKQFLHL